MTTPTSYKLSEVEPYFPIHETLAGKFKTIGENCKKVRAYTERKGSIAAICLIVGGILAIGGLIAILAAHQAPVFGVNTISRLNPFGYVIGYGILTIGLLTIVVISAKLNAFFKKCDTQMEQIRADLRALEDQDIQLYLSNDEVLKIRSDVANRFYTNDKVYTKLKEEEFSTWSDLPENKGLFEDLLEKRKHLLTLPDLEKRSTGYTDMTLSDIHKLYGI